MHLHLLRLDSAAGLLVGVLTAVASPVMAGWYRLPIALLLTTACANLVYGAYSGWLYRQPRPRPLWGLQLLAVANVSWGFVCLALAAHYATRASGLGLAHLLLEAAFVGGLGVTEWRRRMQLQTL